MCRISDIDKLSLVQVSKHASLFRLRSAKTESNKVWSKTNAHGITGSGCVAALEAEKWLSEQEPTVEKEPEVENQAEKSQVNGVVPEYRSSPLL